MPADVPRALKIKYETLLTMLGIIEGQMTNKVEFYDTIYAQSMRNMKAKQEW